MKKEVDTNQYILQSVDNALKVLNLFESTDKLSLTEIAAKMGCGKTIAYRLLYTLENRGFLLRGEDNKYSLGMRLFTLGNKVLSEKSYLPLIQPVLEKLTDTVNESVHLVTWENMYHVILLYELFPQQSLRAEMGKAIGSRPPHMTSTGLALLSTKSDKQIADYAQNVLFEKKTEYSISSREQLEEDVQFVREHGYAINNQRFEKGMVSIAVPIIKNPESFSDFAISVSGPNTRIMEKKEMILEELQKTAMEIGRLL